MLNVALELRKDVYEFALENLRESDRTRSIAQQTVRRHDIPLRPALDYRGLTQVCRELRKEFHPLYLGAKVICVSIKHVLGYLQTYYPTEIPGRVFRRHRKAKLS